MSLPQLVRSDHPSVPAVVPVNTLLPADSPRLDGVSEEHVQRLAEMTSKAPPIVVHRGTMRVVDGMHRLGAAIHQGRTTIDVEFVDGREEEVFLRSVELNAAHGLPLTLADRKAAASRIVASHQELSDRMIARYTGLSDKTVASVRRSAAETPHLNVRMGLDGKRQPLNSAPARQLAGEVIAARPGATLREIAGEAGISVATAKDVRDRMRRGEGPEKSVRPPLRGPLDAKNTAAATLDALRRDPAVRLTDAGRELLRLLNVQASGSERLPELIASIPPHCRESVAWLAYHYASEWSSIEKQLNSVTRVRRADEAS